MGKHRSRGNKPHQRADRQTTPSYDEDYSIPVKPKRAGPLEAKTETQGAYISAIMSSTITLGLGPAGTGKTYIAGAMAAQALLDGEVDQIIITRPAVEAGENLGFLPGELEEKYAPYIAAFRQVLDERLGKSHVDNLLKLGKIRAEPLAYMRGLTFKNAFVVMDEAQNATPLQMKLFLTRIGDRAKVVINGDTEQVDIQGASGLEDAARRLAGVPGVRCVTFEMDDVVRSGICRHIVRAYASA